VNATAAYRHLDEALAGTTRDKVEPLVRELSASELSALYLRSRRAQKLTLAAIGTLMAVFGFVGGLLFAAWMRTHGLEAVVGTEMRNLLILLAAIIAAGAVASIHMRKHRRRMYMLDVAIKLQREREYRVLHSGEPPKTIQ
jgi:CBS domain containing-hemolysin-like protein